MALTRDALAQLLVKQIGLNGREAREMVERFYGEIAATLESGQSVELPDFGEFSVRDKWRRGGGTPGPGEASSGEETRRVAEFHPSGKPQQRKSSEGA